MKPDWFVLCVMFTLSAAAQDTVVKLSPVQVSAPRIEQFSASLSMITIDSLALKSYQLSDLPDMLSSETPVYIKSYGQGSLATISFRGTSATHTGIYWNGVQLNPSTTGLFDLSLAPAGLFNTVRVLEGGSGSLYGSGNIGGSIHLGNEPVFSRGSGLQVSIGKGSFGHYGGILKATVSTRRIFSSTSFVYRESLNNFPYLDLYGSETRQKNAATRNSGIMNDTYWKPAAGWLLGFSGWLQENSREIPATLVTAASFAEQDDKAARAVIQARKIFLKGSVSLKAAYVHDSLHYRNPGSPVESDRDSRITTNRTTAELQGSRIFGKRSLVNAGACLNREVAVSNNFGGKISQDHMGLFVSVLQVLPAIKWKVNLNLRQDFAEGYAVPFTPALGAEGRIWKIISGRLNLSENFRVPSFNELFWKPYGNKDLKPENSWNGEAGIVISPDSLGEQKTWGITATAFSSWVSDWITWVPEGNDWKPLNYAEVWSRGAELNSYYNPVIGKLRLGIQEGYTLAVSTNRRPDQPGEDIYNKQLIYTPLHRLFVNLHAGIKGFSSGVRFSYTGRRYTTSDNLHFLPGFWLMNLAAGKDLKLGKHIIGVQLSVNNLWDQKYQAIEYYPMPGISYYISVNYQFNSK
jgi:iron complex outermembrane receptor protein